MYLSEKHFELIDPNELTFAFQNVGLIESDVDGKEYHKFVVMLLHKPSEERFASQSLVFGTTELFPMKEAVMALEFTNPLGLGALIDDNWYQFEASGCTYDLNFWFDDSSMPQASIYPVEQDENGNNDTDCSTLIHTISNFQIDYE